MTRNEVIEKASAVGLIVKPCANPDFIAVRAGEAHDPNERMRITADGAVLTVADGYYWQVGTVSEVDRYVRGLA